MHTPPTFFARAVAYLMMALMLYPTTMSLSVAAVERPLPSPVAKPITQTPTDWLAATTLRALPDSSGNGNLLRLSDDIDVTDGDVVPSMSPRLVAPEALIGPSLNYLVASAPSVASESSHISESGSTENRSWRVPDGLLKQGNTYYWKVIDQTNDDASEWVSFTVDIHRTGVQPTDDVGPLSVSLASGELTTAAGTLGVPTVAGQLNLSLSYSSARHDATLISPGWSLAGLGILGYTQASYSSNKDAITLTTTDGGTLTFVQSEAEGLWQASPQNGIPAGLAGTLTVSPAGDILYTGVTGSVAMFNAQGLLQSTTLSGLEASAQWQLEWSGDRLSEIIDPVSQRSAKFYYTFPDNYWPAADFDVFPPAGKLTRFINLDGRMTTLFYKGGRLARVEQTGGKVMDFAYDQAGRLTQLRTPEAADLDAHSGSNASRLFTVAYQANGQVASITAPAALSNQPQQSHHYHYSHGQTTVTEQLGSVSTPLKRVSYDDRWRHLSDTELELGYTTTYSWVPNEDKITAVVDSDGLKRTAHFDAYGRITAQYGPALSGQFDNQGLPNHPNVPAGHTVYDVGIDPLVIRAWGQPHFVGAPQAIGIQSTLFNLDELTGFHASDDGWSAILSTVMTVAADGELHLRASVGNNAAVEVTLLVSGAEVVDDNTVTVAQASAGEVLPITVLLSSNESDPRGLLELFSSDSLDSDSRDSGWQAIVASSLSAGLGVTTEERGTEQLSSQDGQVTLSNIQTYQNPLRGTLQSQTLDPSGLRLTQQQQYGADPYGRVTGQVSPSGMSSRFTYWDGGTAACGGAYTQSGNLASMTLPNPNGAERKTTLFYNDSGQQIGIQVGSEPASCLSYDERGRPVSLTVPASGESPSKQLVMHYSLDGELFTNTKTSTVGDTTLMVQVKSDLLGRMIESIDEWGTVVMTDYDDRHRQVITTTVFSDGSSSSITETYDTLGRLLSISRNDETLPLAAVRYWKDGAQIDYANGSTLVTALNALQQLDQQTLTLPSPPVTAETETQAALSVSDQLTLSPSGRILGQAIVDTAGNHSHYGYRFDKGLRLIQATLSGSHAALSTHGYQWDYKVSRAGVVTEETVTRPDGTSEVKQYRYNNVEGLTAIDSSVTGNSMMVNYDASGYNMSELIKGNGDSLALRYDQSAQLIHASDSDGKSVTYQRSADNRLLKKVTEQSDAKSGEVSSTTVLYSSGWTLNEHLQPIAQQISLPGGVMVTIAADEREQRWHYSSLQGHTLLTTNGEGEQLAGLSLYSPYGEVLTAHAAPLEGSPVMGFDGGMGVETETFAIDIALMGDRVYVPTLHSFTTLDPTFNGGSSPYNYANGDPINLSDPSGHAPENRFWKGDFWNVNNPYMWALVAGVAFGATGGGLAASKVISSFAVALAGSLAVSSVAGAVGLFTYGMITTNDWGAAASMAGIGMAYGFGGGLIGFVAGSRMPLRTMSSSPKMKYSSATMSKVSTPSLRSSIHNAVRPAVRPAVSSPSSISASTRESSHSTSFTLLDMTSSSSFPVFLR